MKTGDVVEFNQSKYFKFIREIGSGGTGVANLFKDETTNTLFAIKKYQPIGPNIEYREDFYHRFVEEIKILFNLSHPNIVRVYNYYLYPNYLLGYLQMEYIEGVSIDVYAKNNNIDLNRLFRSAINSFECLEKNNILHRDIRPENMLIDNNGDLKIIDFGFGKILDGSNRDNSIILNWPSTEYPAEVITDRDYTLQTEIYFLGSLFRRLIKENDIIDFRFINVIEKMCETKFEQRYQSFEDISSDIAKGILLQMDFTASEKNAYQSIADLLTILINHHINNFYPETEVEKIQNDLEVVLKNCALEEFVQDNSLLISCFLKNGFSYSKRKIVKVKTIQNFYQLLLNSDAMKKEIIIENLRTRLSLINIKSDFVDISDDDLPF
ncbi:protein kinase family protein [Enterococcus italicus]|uniref:protein kinase family protein n=1 Tax=Enterococcus italicus TaxID=246144 RepID=UPI003F44FE25